MKTFTHAIEVAAPPERVWDLTIDVERWPALFPTVTSIVRVDPGPMAVGSSARIRQPAQPERLWTVVTCDAPRRFVWVTQGLGFTMRADHEIAPTPTGGAINRLTLDIDGPMAGLLAAVAGRKLREVLAIENEGFRVAAEAAATQGAHA